jgi:hypothetical protein
MRRIVNESRSDLFLFQLLNLILQAISHVRQFLDPR